MNETAFGRAPPVSGGPRQALAQLAEEMAQGAWAADTAGRRDAQYDNKATINSSHMGAG